MIAQVRACYAAQLFRDHEFPGPSCVLLLLDGQVCGDPQERIGRERHEDVGAKKFDGNLKEDGSSALVVTFGK